MVNLLLQFVLIQSDTFELYYSSTLSFYDWIPMLLGLITTL